MLHTIRIQNFALIENAEIPFKKGLNVLSGETGAGKSIIIEAISLLLGGRANADVIRHGTDEALVEGLFDISEIPYVADRLKEVGIAVDADHELLIKRSVSRNGKNRIYLNGEIATLHMLQLVTEGLVDLCGQHEHQSLFKTETQLDLLDRYGDLSRGVATARAHFVAAFELKKEWEDLKKKEEERVQRLEFIRFQIDELQTAQLQPGEDERLMGEKKLLQSVEQRLSLARQLDAALSGDEAGLQKIKFSLKQARQLCAVDEGAQLLTDSLERALAELEDAEQQVRQYLDRVDASPESLDQIQGRLSLIINLKRKYGQSVDDILAHQGRLVAEADLLDNLSSRLEGLEADFDQARKKSEKSAVALFQDRKKAAKSFSAAVMKELKELRMSDTAVDLSLTFEENFNSWGPDRLGTEIDFLVQPNLGEEKRSIQKIVSGGELSRLMLAIRRVISDRGGIGVYLFDEIDAGLGGQTAFTVGKKLKSVARFNQVLCITHVPQVACFADHHLSIIKKTTKGRTVTTVDVLSVEGQREELARMLGAEKITPAALKNARDLLSLARS